MSINSPYAGGLPLQAEGCPSDCRTAYNLILASVGAAFGASICTRPRNRTGGRCVQRRPPPDYRLVARTVLHTSFTTVMFTVRRKRRVWRLQCIARAPGHAESRTDARCNPFPGQDAACTTRGAPLCRGPPPGPHCPLPRATRTMTPWAAPGEQGVNCKFRHHQPFSPAWSPQSPSAARTLPHTGRHRLQHCIVPCGDTVPYVKRSTQTGDSSQEPALNIGQAQRPSLGGRQAAAVDCYPPA